MARNIQGGNKKVDHLSRNRPIRARYLDYVTGYQPIRDQYFLHLRLNGLGMIPLFQNTLYKYILESLDFPTNKIQHAINNLRTVNIPGLPLTDPHDQTLGDGAGPSSLCQSDILQFTRTLVVG